MTETDAATRAAVERLLLAVAQASAGDDLPAWGAAGPGRRWPDGVLVANPLDPTFATVEAVPWPEETTGVVEATFRAGSEPTWHEVQEWFGPMPQLPQLDDAPTQFTASWSRPDAPTSLLVIVDEPDDPGGLVTRLTIRRDPVR